MKNEVVQEFRKIAGLCQQQLKVADTFCEFSKHGIALRAYWSIDRINGVFVTLINGSREYGLPYLVEFKGGASVDLTDAISDNPKATAEVAKKYAIPFLTSSENNFPEFVEFTEKKLREKGSEKRGHERGPIK